MFKLFIYFECFYLIYLYMYKKIEKYVKAFVLIEFWFHNMLIIKKNK